VPIDTSIAATSGSATPRTIAAICRRMPPSAHIYKLDVRDDSLGTANTVQVTWKKTGKKLVCRLWQSDAVVDPTRRPARHRIDRGRFQQ